jgi:hypothetical protein
MYVKACQRTALAVGLSAVLWTTYTEKGGRKEPPEPHVEAFRKGKVPAPEK